MKHKNLMITTKGNNTSRRVVFTTIKKQYKNKIHKKRSITKLIKHGKKCFYTKSYLKEKEKFIERTPTIPRAPYNSLHSLIEKYSENFQETEKEKLKEYNITDPYGSFMNI